MRSTLSVLALGLVVAADDARAQQFTYQPGLLAGSFWSEGVEAVDVDLDGDLDLVFADGDGFASASTQRQARLHINQFVPTGVLSFTEESTTRFGVNLSNGKGVATGDANGDGWPDVLITNGFNTDPPFLYINQGAANPGFFTLESATRGFTESLSSAGAQFGDIDDDGDLDIVICDSGNAFLGGAGDVARVYRNDGLGFFTRDAAALTGPAKNSQMDVQLIDVDNDWDLDFFGVCRGSNSGNNHYLMLNDGAGNFTDVSSTLPATSTSVYEAEAGDLDGDDDVDLFFVSLSGFREGHVANNLVPNGSVSWTAGAPLTASVDDNEIVLIDFDVDGDYDILVGSLSGTEYMYRNQGGLTWLASNTSIQAVADSTLDATAADLDNDGAYELITAQGESNAAQFVNKVYRNNGAADTLAPVIVASRNLDAPPAGWPFVFHAKIRDQVLDDGINHVSAEAWAAPFRPATSAVSFNGTSFSNANIVLAPGQAFTLQNASAFGASFEITGPYSGTLDLGPGQSFDKAFAAPGVFGIGIGAANLVVTVQGPSTRVSGLRMGGQIYRFALPPIAAGPAGEFLVEALFSDWPGNVSAIQDVVLAAPGGQGSALCAPGIANSRGLIANLVLTGSASVAANELVLNAVGLPVNQFGYFLTSLTAVAPVVPPNSVGRLCLGGSVGRYNQSVANSGAAGAFSLGIDFTSMPLSPPVAASAGQTWHFQAWYRDVQLPGGATSNFTEGRSVLLQ